MPVFTWTPSYGPELQMEPKFDESNYGDGYKQIVPKGINNMPEDWNLRFNNRAKTEADDIDNFLRAMNGAPFDWLNPDGKLIKANCKKWSKTRASFGGYDVTAIFEQWFGA